MIGSERPYTGDDGRTYVKADYRASGGELLLFEIRTIGRNTYYIHPDRQPSDPLWYQGKVIAEADE